MGWSAPSGLRALVLCLSTLAALSPVAAQSQKGTLVFAVESLGAQTMDPILEARPGNAIYQAPMYDSLVGFDLEKGGIGPGVAELVLGDQAYYTPDILKPGSSGAYPEALGTTLRRGGGRHSARTSR